MQLLLTNNLIQNTFESVSHYLGNHFVANIAKGDFSIVPHSFRFVTLWDKHDMSIIYLFHKAGILKDLLN